MGTWLEQTVWTLYGCGMIGAGGTLLARLPRWWR